MTSAWYSPALALLLADSPGRGPVTGWLALRGHRAYVLVPCDGGGPFGVIRRWTDATAAEHEHRMLAQLWSQDDARVLAVVPTNLGTLTANGVTVTVQRWLSGASMRDGSSGDLAARDLSTMREWLACRVATLPLSRCMPNHLSRMLLQRIRRLAPSSVLAEGFRAFLARFDLDEAPAAECGVMHNDLHPGNVLLDDRGGVSGILDWEHAGPGPVLCDWMTFVNEYALDLRRRGRRASVRAESILRDTWFAGGSWHELVRTETRRLLESSRASRDARELCWRLAALRFAYVRSRHDRVSDDAVAAWLRRPAPAFIRD